MAENKLTVVSGGNAMRGEADNLGSFLSPIEDVIEDIRNGKMVVVVDDEDRENEGDLVVAGQMATPDVVNFMAKYGRGLICLAMTSGRVNQLGLSLMSTHNRTQFQTAFTVSIEARDGVTTGISASDRAHTIAVAIDPTKDRHDIVTPGHVFPLIAQEGGVLKRAGHTEASVDLARLAGLNPAGVICEIMNDDGTMARLPDLIKFAQFHGLKVATIADLIAYRLRNDGIIDRVLNTRLVRKHGGEFKLTVYQNRLTKAEHIAIVKGDVSGTEPVLVRMHALNFLDDVLHDQTSGFAGELEGAIRLIGEAGRGVVVLIREPWAERFSNQVRARHELPDDPSAASAEVSLTSDNRETAPPALRDYGVGAQILVDLGVKEMILLTNRTRTIVGLEGYGLKLVERRPIPHVEI